MTQPMTSDEWDAAVSEANAQMLQAQWRQPEVVVNDAASFEEALSTVEPGTVVRIQQPVTSYEWEAALEASPLIMELPQAVASCRYKDDMIAKLNRDNIKLQAKLGTLQGVHDRLMADFTAYKGQYAIVEHDYTELQQKYSRLMADFNALMARAAKTPIVPQPVADVFPVNALNWSVPGYGINPWRRGS